MCTPACVIGMLGCPVLNEAGKEAVKAVIKKWKYVRQYRMHVDNLRAELRCLEDTRVIIERRVREARDRGEEIENAVSHWQADTGRMENDVQELIGQVEARMHCFACSCPNIKWRYRLGKQGDEKIRDVQRLIEISHFEEISYPKPPPPELEFPSADNYVQLDSRTPIFEQIVVALRDPNVKMIGIHGLGGVGKTTLVEKVAKKMLDDGTYKQIPLATVSKVLNVKEIQKKLADKLNLMLDARADEKAIAIQLWNKFKNGEKYLVILDDIWEMVDLKAIGIPITDGQIGCKVVLTSRNKDLLEINMRTDRNFPIAELEEGEAWYLFKKQVRKSMESRPGMESLAREVCKKCKGLPVAIKALGAALEGKPVYMWENALVKLKRFMLTNIEGINSSVWASLRVSYDMLESSDAKSCFLLCCLFTEDFEISIDDLTRHCVVRSLLSQNPPTLEEARDAIRTVVYILKSTSLLSNGSNENVVKIHDVIRDVGISIAREEQAFLVDHGALQWPRNLVNEPSAISLNSGKIRELPDGLVYPHLHTLILDNNELSDLKVPDNFFDGMKQLTVLILTRIRMRRLPSSLAKLSNLRMFCPNQCELADIAILGDLKTNLEVLSLWGSDIEALPPEMAQLTGLRVLDLRDCDVLKVIPQGIISNLTILEELYFADTFDKWEATIDEKKDTSISRNVSIEEIRSLLNTGQLTTLHICIPAIMPLPKEDLMLENLKRFRISMGTNIEWYEDFQGARVLKYEGSFLRKEFIPLVDRAENLCLSGIKGLNEVLDDRGVGNEFLDLKYLKVESCDGLEYLLGEPKSSVLSHGLYPVNHLTVLIVEKCKFKYLFSPTTTRGLVHLEHLVVVSCENMEEIVRFEGQNDGNELILSKLKRMSLESLPRLTSFYTEKEKMRTLMESSSASAQPLFNEKVVFPALEDLSIWKVHMITNIWSQQPLLKPEKEVESFSKLKSIRVGDCHQLEFVLPFYMLPQLHNLLELDIRDCKELEVIVSNKLKEKEATNNDILVFPQLNKLTLKRLDKLECFYTGTQLLFSHKVILPVLETLHISKVGNIIEIWDKQSIAVFEAKESFCQLKYVIVWDCNKLIHVYPYKMHPLLKNLKELKVSKCETMEGVVGFDEDGLRNEQVCFSELRILDLSRVPKLVSFYTEMGEAGTTEGNPTIHAQPLFNGRVAFPALEDLTIWVVPMITDIWAQQSLLKPEKEVESFCKLKSIAVWDCHQLEYVLPSYMLPQLHNLLKLDIRDCKELEVIVSNKLKDKEVTNNDILVFPQLKKLLLWGLDNLKSFFAETQLLFSYKVAFPAVEYLYITKLPKITEVWSKQPLPQPDKQAESFGKINYIHVDDCDQLVYVFPSYMLPQLQTNLQMLEIRNCKEMELVFSEEVLEKIESTHNDIFVFRQLFSVKLQGLPKLKSFYAGTPLFFSDKDAFPVLEINTLKEPWELLWPNMYNTSCIDPDLKFLVDGTSRNEESGTSSKDEDNIDHNKEEEEDGEEDVKNTKDNEGGGGGGGVKDKDEEEGGGGD